MSDAHIVSCRYEQREHNHRIHASAHGDEYLFAGLHEGVLFDVSLEFFFYSILNLPNVHFRFYFHPEHCLYGGLYLTRQGKYF